MFRWLALALLLNGCQTAQQRSEALVAKRVAELSHLTSYKPTWCHVDTELTEPAKARFESMFPSESASDLSFVWRSRETSCEISPLKPSAIAKTQQAFLETALCLLMQVHFVNSPFDEMEVRGIAPKENLTFISSGGSKELGLYLPKDSVTVETRTRSRGVLRAEYSERDGALLPIKLEQILPNTHVTVDEIEYANPRTLKSFWISVGAENPLRHSKIEFHDCRPL